MPIAAWLLVAVLTTMYGAVLFVPLLFREQSPADALARRLAEMARAERRHRRREWIRNLLTGRRR